MITEDFCSFEIAKLLKEKGFDEKVHTFYISETEIANTNIKHNYNGESIYLSAPTHQMAMKWLREKHNIHIKVHCSGNRNYLVYAQSLVTAFPDFCIESATCSFNSPEEAYEAAIKYCLINLI